ncbi:MAG: alpha/beta hydrolase, partial [Pseudomonadota bacterium]
MRPLIVIAMLLLAACESPNSVTRIGLMEPPVVYASGQIDPFPATLPPDRDIPYATQRSPSGPGDDRTYADRPSTILRVGHAEVAIGAEDGQAVDTTTLLPREERAVPLVVDIDRIREAGPLAASRHPAADPALFPEGTEGVDAAFADRVNRQITAAEGDDIVIYVHGTRADFENPVLAAAELQHFSGYRNVFLAYAWPANTGFLTYFQDTEDSENAAFQFRRFIRFLAAETTARRIHVIAHSAGTRMVSEALGQFGLEYATASPARIRDELALGQVILIGSDADPSRVGSQLIEGANRIVERLMIYASGRDRALNVSTLLFGERNRLGQTTTERLPDYVETFLNNLGNMTIIDVTDAERSNVANGHGYLRGSPWVSSDILAAVNFDLDPAARGLVRRSDGLRWSF